MVCECMLLRVCINPKLHVHDSVPFPHTYRVRSVRTRFYPDLQQMGTSIQSSGNPVLPTPWNWQLSDSALGDWVREAHWLWNTQTRMLAGNFTSFEAEVAQPAGNRNIPRPTREDALSWSSGESGRALLEAAKQRLRTMAWFGLIEDLETSVKVAAATFCLQEDELINNLQGLASSRVTLPSSDRTTSRQEELKKYPPGLPGGAQEAAVEDHFALDLELHQYAQELLQIRWASAKQHRARGGCCVPLGLPECEVACPAR